METIFRSYYPNVRKNENINTRQFFIKKFSEIIIIRNIPDCHNLISKIIRAFYRTRVNIKSGVNIRLSKLNLQKKIYSSKSQAMHSTIT